MLIKQHNTDFSGLFFGVLVTINYDSHYVQKKKSPHHVMEGRKKNLFRFGAAKCFYQTINYQFMLDAKKRSTFCGFTDIYRIRFSVLFITFIDLAG